jgi:hypothetical protein
MNSITTRIARMTVASALAVGLGALGAGPALADEASPDGVGRVGGIKSVTLADDASPDGLGKPSGGAR